LIVIKEAIIVEGKYDKIKLSSFIDAMIIETHGFRIFKDKAQMNLIRKMADTKGLLILTDSDSAGFLIRNYLKSAIPLSKVKHAYIPDILGKESRKQKYSQEGKLGVEGVEKDLIIKALQKAGVLTGEHNSAANFPRRSITKSDFFSLGLTGSSNSHEKRKKLLCCLQLPEHMSANAMIEVLNSLMTYEEFYNYAQALQLNP